MTFQAKVHELVFTESDMTPLLSESKYFGENSKKEEGLPDVYSLWPLPSAAMNEFPSLPDS